ncbi:TRAP transporter small permease [Thioclava sp. 15-R06ZXC-3]|jgi:TRAP-type C4-dicarboxylate transport system permease small subunit|uniref:TRAP transporter small permease protein n=1 Tax=Thioclava arctica TaxID=3238301 RepID=A0ABV3THU8_9RHOB
MRDVMEKLAVWTGWLGQAALWLSGIGLVLMTAFVFAQVFYRYVLGSSLFWAEPASVILMGWFIFLGAAVGIREGYHLSFDVLLFVLPEKARLTFFSISDLVVAAFGFGMLKYGWLLADKMASTTISGIGVSGAFRFVPVLAGGALLMIFCAERILRRFAGLPTARFGDDHEAAELEGAAPVGEGN